MGEKSEDTRPRGATGAPIDPNVKLENPGVTEADVGEREAAEAAASDTADEGKGSGAAHK